MVVTVGETGSDGPLAGSLCPFVSFDGVTW